MFLAVGVHRYVGRDQHELGLVLLALAVGVGAAGLIRPASVRWLFVGCMVATFPIGWVVSKALLMLLFINCALPLAVFLRLRGRDTLSRKPPPIRRRFGRPSRHPKT